MLCGPAADDAAPQQFRGEQLDGPPVAFVGEHVFGLGEQSLSESGSLAFAGPLHREAVDIAVIAGERRRPAAVKPVEPRLSRDASCAAMRISMLELSLRTV